MAGNRYWQLARARSTARLVRTAYRAPDRALGIKNRPRKIKLRALSDFAIDPNSPAVNLDEMLRNRQSQAGAASLARTRCIHTIKSLKNPRLIRFRNPNPRIRNRK